MKQTINIFWFKRDLRILDNSALERAIKENNRLLLIFTFDDALLNDKHYTTRHYNFINESLYDLNLFFKKFGCKVHSFEMNIISLFEELKSKFNINKVFSHMETGLKSSYDRDLKFKKYCKKNNIEWIEDINNGVFRGLQSRKNWILNWNNYMKKKIRVFNPKVEDFITLNKKSKFERKIIKPKKSKFQCGGSTYALKYLETFLETRIDKYQNNISKPELSRINCSRLSPYIAWGNLSTRYIWQRAKEKLNHGKSKFQINGFTSRLRWEAHFIQKFEMESDMEFRSVNRGYEKQDKNINKTYIRAWENGETGYPLVDASMKCLIETGYLNFRMRAMLVSFFTHHLWQPWKAGVVFLANNFLDFEPGIHYSQFQMQAGETGINMIRIYNPTKNAKEHDKEGVFIKKWIPELKDIPAPVLFEPWKMSLIDQVAYHCKIGKDYPKPIIDISETYKYAASKLWSFKSNNLVKEESNRILQKHTNANRQAFDD